MAKIQRKGEMIFWLMVFGAILLHHQSVFFYFDDYAYATLSYSVAVPGVTGTNYGLLDILSFCILHWGNGAAEFCSISFIFWRLILACG